VFSAVHWATGRSCLDTFLSAALNLFELIEKFSGKFRDKKLSSGVEGSVEGPIQPCALHNSSQCYIHAQKFETFPILLAGFTLIASGQSLSGSHDLVVLFS
jgi:hypothetical protein